MKKFGVWCEVYGGVTGHRQAWLKENGAVVMFDTHEEAAERAKKLSDDKNGNPYRTANFEYSAREITFVLGNSGTPEAQF
jgi:hypothetical protein